uniref:Uncharacterized protein n=1 Tax=Rhizophagus irregularis (strain DAOM 181602 / DAOM 197198 / MUCL 43194) TaxID=747089 RepID=U9SH32_RHIID
MATRKTIPKTRKLKTNNFVTILEQHLDKYNLSANSTLEQLREHAPELNAQLHDWTDRKSIKDLLNLADVIVMLSMRPSEVSSLQIIHYEPESEDPPACFNEFLKQKPYKSLPKDLRKTGGKHACRTHGGPKSTPQHLSNLTKIALRHYIGLDAGNNYSKGDTETEDSESDHNPESESESAENDEISDIINMYSY